MSVILAQSWEQTAQANAQTRGAALPRHAIPSDAPSYYSTTTPSQYVSGSIVLPVVHWDATDQNGAQTGDHYTQYAHVIISRESHQKLMNAGIVKEDTPIYDNFHDCVEDIKKMNMEAHEDYLMKYQKGALSHVAEWVQRTGIAQTVKDLCVPPTQCAPQTKHSL